MQLLISAPGIGIPCCFRAVPAVCLGFGVYDQTTVQIQAEGLQEEWRHRTQMTF